MINTFTSIRMIYIKSLFILFISTLLISCEENRRVIVPFVPEGDRVVLLEEFTGKGCTNCPKGSREIENLLTLFPENLIAVSIHAGFFANPQLFPLGQYDLRTDEGELLIDYLGSPIGYPSGVVNRTLFNGEMQLGANAWSSAISQYIQTPPAVDLAIEREYNEATRELTLTVNGIGKEAISGELKLSIMLTESGIVDAQDDQEAGGIVQDYVHRHVLRDMLTPATGETLTTNFSIGQTFSKTFATTIDPVWVVSNMDLIAFVTIVNGNNFPVLQAVHIGVAE
ncbi:MAG: Omp28-related outer membrane protein [Bacteroidota bacterium]|nr:Omp28-related outer membrane protein [Bacteroidota bacterium]